MSSLLHNSDIVLSKYNLGLLAQLQLDLTQQKVEITTAITNMKKKLEVLWECLEVDNNVRKKFNAYTGCSQVKIKILYFPPYSKRVRNDISS